MSLSDSLRELISSHSDFIPAGLAVKLIFPNLFKKLPFVGHKQAVCSAINDNCTVRSKGFQINMPFSLRLRYWPIRLGSFIFLSNILCFDAVKAAPLLWSI